MNGFHPFESPIEAGFRALFVLAAAEHRPFDLQRLVLLDYAVVHSSDLNGPPSLHPPTPERRAEVDVRRSLVQQGLALMVSRELVERVFAADGIVYRATKVGRHVVSQFDMDYADDLRERASWVIARFAATSDETLRSMVDHG